LEDIPAFLRSFLSDPKVMPIPWPIRPLLARRIAKRRSLHVAEHYRAIGGGSPINEQSRRQADALQRELGDRYVVRHAFRHSAPLIPSAIREFQRLGLRRVLALPAYPQESHTTTSSALEELSRAIRPTGMCSTAICSYADAPGFAEAIADLAAPFISPEATVLFCAHGLPERIVRAGDPYLEEVQRTFSAVAAKLPRNISHSLAFQSRMGRQEWTRPYLNEEVERLARAGAVSLVLIPISFICENLETLFELDIEVSALAARSGIRSVKRVPTPSCHSAFIRELARLVHDKVRESGWDGVEA
jgi:ferrochelatase